MRRFVTLDITVGATSRAAYEAVRSAFENFKPTQDVSVDIEDLVGFGLSTTEQLFDAKITFPADSAQYLQGALAQLVKSVSESTAFMSNEQTGRVAFNSPDVAEWVETTLAPSVGETADASRADADRYSWETKDIIHSLLVLIVCLAIGMLTMAFNTGSIWLAFAKGWPILVIVALVGIPAALLWGLRTK